MKFEEITAMLDETGYPVAYDHFTEGEAPDPPFIVFLFPKSNNFSADGKVYQRIDELNVELYTDVKQPELEARLEAIFDDHELFYEKTEVWLPEEKLYEVLYVTEIVLTTAGESNNHQ